MVFVFTGFMGFTIGPMVNAVSADTLIASLGMTAAIFLGLSGYVLTTKRDFSFLKGFIMVGLVAMVGAIIMSWIFDLGAFETAISAGRAGQ